MIAGVLMVFAAGLTGCGQSFKSQSSTGTLSQTATDISSEMTKAEEANQLALAAMSEANNALKDITDDKGNINIGLFSKTGTAQVSSQALMDPIIAKLRVVFYNVFARVSVVKVKFGEARQLLLTAIAKLDSNIPEQAAMISQVMSQLAKIDAMERQFSASMHSLAGKLDLAVIGLERLVSGATSFIPGFGFIAGLALDYLVMNDIKAFIAEIKMRLLTL